MSSKKVTTGITITPEQKEWLDKQPRKYNLSKRVREEILEPAMETDHAIQSED